MKEIYAAFVKAQQGFAPALKSSLNPHFKSKYADLSACVEAVIDSLNANGIGLIQKTYPDDSGVTVETVFVHTSGESLDGGKLHVPASKQDPQGYGSALSYARRYSLMAACGIAPEDDDGQAAAKATAKARPAVSLTDTLEASVSMPRKRTGVMADVLSHMPPLSSEDSMYYKELAANVEDLLTAQGAAVAYDRVTAEGLDNDKLLYLWAEMPSKVRSAFKAEKAARQMTVAA